MTERGNNDTLVAVKREEASSGHLVRTYALFALKGRRITYVTSAKGRLLRRQRMVAHNVADVPFVSAVMLRRRTFFQEDPSIVFLTVRLFVVPPDKVEVEPGFVVAALISRADTKSFMENGECAVKPNFPTNVSPLAWNRSRSSQWCGAKRHRQCTGSKGLFNDTNICWLLSRRHAAPLKSPANKSSFSSSITARIVRISFFPMPRFLA